MPSYPISRRALRASALALVIGAGLTGPVALATTAGAAVSSATATAAVNEYDWQLTYTAAAHQANKVTIAESYTSGHEAITYVIDDVVPIRAGHGCSYPVAADHTRVTCAVVALESQDPYAALEMSLGDGNDTVTSRNATGQVYYLNRIDLGSGNDRLTDNTGLDGNEVVGGTGNDTITVGKLASVLAGDGNDTVNAAWRGQHRERWQGQRRAPRRRRLPDPQRGRRQRHDLRRDRRRLAVRRDGQRRPVRKQRRRQTVREQRQRQTVRRTRPGHAFRRPGKEYRPSGLTVPAVRGIARRSVPFPGRAPRLRGCPSP